MYTGNNLQSAQNQAHCMTNVWFQKIPMQQLSFYVGGKVSKKATFLKEIMNQNWNFEKDSRLKKKPSRGCWGKDIFWNSTITGHRVATDTVLEINIEVKVTYFIPL